MVLGCWLIAFGAAAVLEYAPHASLWFPPTAVTFAAVLVIGPRALPGPFLACIFVVMMDRQIFSGVASPAEVLLTGISFGVVHTAAYGGLALLLRTATEHSGPLSSFPRVNAFLIGGAIAAGIPSVLGALALDASGSGELEKIIAPRWIGDYAGLITLAPLMMILFAKVARHLELPLSVGLRRLIRPQLGQPALRNAWPKLLALSLVTLGVLGVSAALPKIDSLVFLLFLCLPVQLWLVYTESTLSSLLGVLLFALLLAAAASLGPLGEQAMLLQFVVISLAISSYLGLLAPGLYRDNHRLRQLLTHDGLTGALSRSFFEDAAREGLQQCQLKQQAATLVMIDLDNLKHINDSHGHAAGDWALKRLSEVCQTQLASGDLIGRLGGDEFALFLHHSEPDQTELLLQRIGRELAIQVVETDGDNKAALKLSASFGVAVATPGADACDYAGLLKAADLAMYRRKRKPGP
ncbi:MAG: diguanylate cyclase [Wenzhouxiangella sp.]